jgi:hypothetical protein
MASAVLELVLHRTFGYTARINRYRRRTGPNLLTPSSHNYDAKESLYRRVKEHAVRIVMENCRLGEYEDGAASALPLIDGSDRTRPSYRQRRGGAARPATGGSHFALVQRLRGDAAGCGGNERFRGMYRSFFKTYDVRSLLRDDESFRDAATSLFQMMLVAPVASSSSSYVPPLSQSAFVFQVGTLSSRDAAAVRSSSLSSCEGEFARATSNKHLGDLTAIFLRVRDGGFHDLIQHFEYSLLNLSPASNFQL